MLDWFGTRFAKQRKLELAGHSSIRSPCRSLISIAIISSGSHQFDASRERMRQIEANAISKLRRASHADKLGDFLESSVKSL